VATEVRVPEQIPFVSGVGRAGIALATVTGVSAAILVAVSPAAGAAIVAMAILGALALFWPGVVLGLYLLIPFYKGGLQAYSPIDLTLILVAANTFQIVPLILDRRPHHISQAAVILWPILAILVLAGVMYAPDQDLALAAAVNWGLLVFVPIGLGALRVGSDPRYVRQLLWTFFGLGVVVVILGLAQLSSVERLEVLNADTINVARAALLVPILAAVFVLHRVGRLTQVVIFVLIPASFVVALASGSRGPVLVFLFLAVAAAVRWVFGARSMDRRVTRGVVGVALASILIGSVTAASIPAESLERFGGFGRFVESGLAGELNTSTGDTSAGARVTLFGVAVALFADHPVLGVGTAGYAALSPRYLSPDETFEYPHNAVLQFAAEYGIIGAAIYIAFASLALIRRLPGDGARAIRVLLLFFLANAMISTNAMEDRMVWGLIMLVLFIDVGPPVLQVESLRAPPLSSEHQPLTPQIA
jgi:O-antigen ligase